MKFLKQQLILCTVSIFFWGCSSLPANNKIIKKEEPVIITNENLAYEIIIIDAGFTSFLNSIAKPEGHYSKNYIEARNRVWVSEWNNRARNHSQFNANIYENIVDYQSTIDYGYEVNYKLFNYFLFAQQKYKINLGGGFRGNRIN